MRYVFGVVLSMEMLGWLMTDREVQKWRETDELKEKRAVLAANWIKRKIKRAGNHSRVHGVQSLGTTTKSRPY